MKKPTLIAYSHYVKVTDFDDNTKQILYRFIHDNLIQYDVTIDPYGKMTTTQKYIFATSDAARTEFRFHVNMLPMLLEHLSYYGQRVDRSEVIMAPPPEYAPAEFQIKEGWEPREGQILALEYIFEKNPLTKMIALQAGAGKTATAFFAMAKAKMRTLLVIKPSLQSQWTKDAYPKQIDYKAGDILSISGRSDLLSLINLALANELKAKFIVISNVTLQRYISEWEASGTTDKTPLAPDDLIKLLKVGIVIQDEWHLFFHLNFKIDLYTNIIHNIKLSATVEPDDPFLDKMFNIAAPKATRFNGVEYNKYVHVTGYCYTLEDAHKLRISNRGRTSYSHKKFEESLMKKKKQLDNYLEMISWLVQDDYITEREPGMKSIIFADRVDMCEAIKNKLQEDYPFLKVGKKTSGDPESVLTESDVIVSTLGSLGAGTDIDDVFHILMTTSVSARSANEQAKGRAREMKKFKGTKPKFTYLYTKDLRKQEEYHNKKLEDFRGKCLSHRTLLLPHRV